MKILVVSLLRLGDILMTTPAIQAIRKQNPDDEIHLLINEEFAFCKSMIPEVDHFHFFPRKRLQESLGDASDPILFAFDDLTEFLASMRREGFEQIFNFTQNRLSAYLIAGMESPIVFGMHGPEESQLKIDGSWFQYLNRPPEQVRFHRSEIFLRAVGSNHLLPVVLNPPAAVDLLPVREHRLIFALQIFSNEYRKMAPDSFWVDLAQQITQHFEDVHFAILAAPWEVDRATVVVSEMSVLGVSSSICECSFKEALGVLNQVDMLISVDTSIKHLSASTETPTLEISFDASQSRFYGVFKDSSYIAELGSVDTRSNLRIVQDLALVCEKILDPQRFEDFDWRSISFPIRKTRIFENKFWFLEDLNGFDDRSAVFQLIDQAVDFCSVVAHDNVEVMSAGDLGFSLAEAIADLCRNRKVQYDFVIEYLRDLEKRARLNNESFQKIENRYPHIWGNGLAHLDWLDEAHSSLGVNPQGTAVEISNGQIENVVAISELRRARNLVDRELKQSEWSLRFLRSITNHLMEIS